MRGFGIILCLMAISFADCSKPGVPFRNGGEFSAAEKATLGAIDPDLRGWRPHYSALWNRGGTVRRVFLFRNDIASIVEHEDVLVFDGEGHLVEANVIEVSTGNQPQMVVGVSPVRVRFRFAPGSLGRVGLAYSSLEDGVRNLRERCAEARRVTADLHRDSGSTSSHK
jgi:hypothetical protein